MHKDQIARSEPLGISELATPKQLDQTTLQDIGERLISLSETMPVSLIPLKAYETIESLSAMFPGEVLCASDFYIEGAEDWLRVEGGFKDPTTGILNIDHHAPHHSMYHFISSGVLAAEYVAANGPFQGRIINNHTDCDSIISRLIMGGEIPPLQIFTNAVVAADHTGESHPIAELLQAIDSLRDVRLSTRNLGLLLAGRPLEPIAEERLEARRQARRATEAFVKAGNFECCGSVVLMHFDGELRNEFLPDLLPEAAIFLTVEPGNSGDARKIMRLRLGSSAPPGLTLFDLDIERLDPQFGGRWNAGSNKRGGGSDVDPREYAGYLDRGIRAYQAHRERLRPTTLLDTLTDSSLDAIHTGPSHHDVEIAGVAARVLGPISAWGLDIHVTNAALESLQEAIVASSIKSRVRLSGYISSTTSHEHRFHLSRLPRRLGLKVPTKEEFRDGAVNLIQELNLRGIAHRAAEEQPAANNTVRAVYSAADGSVYSEPAVEVVAEHTENNLARLAVVGARLRQARISLETLQSGRAFNVEFLESSSNTAAQFG